MDGLDNRVVLSVCIVDKQAMRTSLTGVSVVDLVVQHASNQVETGVARQTQFELAAVAMGDVAVVANTCVVGAYYKVQGFLNRKSLKSVKLRLHITHISPL